MKKVIFNYLLLVTFSLREPGSIQMLVIFLAFMNLFGFDAGIFEILTMYPCIM